MTRGERGWVGARGGREGARARANFNMSGGREARGGERRWKGARGGREGDRRSEEKLSWDTAL